MNPAVGPETLVPSLVASSSSVPHTPPSLSPVTPPLFPFTVPADVPFDVPCYLTSYSSHTASVKRRRRAPTIPPGLALLQPLRDNAGVCFVNAYVENVVSYVLLDGASVYSLINAQFARDNALHTFAAPPASITVGNGATVDISTATIIKVKIGSLVLDVTAYLVEDCPVEVLVGWNDIKRHGIVVDPVEMKAYPKHDPDSFAEILKELPTIDDAHSVPVLPVRARASSEFVIPPHQSMAVEVVADAISPLRSLICFNPSSDHEHTGARSRRLFKPLPTITVVNFESKTFLINVQNRCNHPVVIRRHTVLGTVSWDFQSVEARSPPSANACVATGTSANASTVGDIISNYIESSTHLTDAQRVAASAVIAQFTGSLFVTELDASRPAPPGEFSVITTSDEPVADHHRRHTLKDQRVITNEVRKQEKAGIFSKCSSAYRAPIVLVKKKDGTMRMCIDYSKLNAVTVRDLHPLPHMDDLFSNLRRARFYTTLDLAAGYWQVRVRHKDRAKLAFATPIGTFAPNRMPFGLTNAPAYFQRMMTSVLGDAINDYVMVYLDDVIIFSNTFEEHLDHIRKVFTCLDDNKLQVKVTKCEFFKTQVKYLGFIVGNDSIRPDPSSVAAVTQCKSPTTFHQLQKVLGATNYYRKFIENYADLAEPLIRLTADGGSKFHWTTTHETALRRILHCLTTAPVLALPDISPDAPPFVLYTDASNVAIGAVLSQLPPDSQFALKETYRPIAYFSKTLSEAERKYSTTERELYAIVKAIEHFRHYLYANFIVVTDHQALVHLLPSDRAPSRIHRWSIRLLGYHFAVHYRKGIEHDNADAMSRPPFISDGKHASSLPMSSTSTSVSLAMPMIPSGAVEIKTIQWDRLQALDPLCKAVRARMSQTLPKENPLFRIATLILPFAVLHEGILYYNRRARGQTSNVTREINRIIVPSTVREALVTHAHTDIIDGGHFGSDKTLARLNRSYFWPRMEETVATHVSKCSTCERLSPVPSHRPAILNPILTFRPWDIVGLDIAGPLPAVDGCEHFLLAVDLFSRWVEAFPLRDTSSSTIAETFLRLFVARFGVPKAIITDQGANLNSAELFELFDYLHIDKRRSTAAHPQTDGAAERAIGTIKKTLTAALLSKAGNWVSLLPFACSAYNGAVHSITGVSPFKALFGSDKRSLLDNIAQWETIPTPTIDFNTLSQGSAILHERMTSIWREMRLQIARNVERQKKYFDKTHPVPSIVAGELVWFYPILELSRLPAFTAKRNGPYKVQDVLDNGVIVISHPTDKDQIYTTNVQRLELVKSSPSPSDMTNAEPLPKASASRPAVPPSIASIRASGDTSVIRHWWDGFRSAVQGVLNFLVVDEGDSAALEADRAELVKLINNPVLGISDDTLRYYTHLFQHEKIDTLRDVVRSIARNTSLHFPNATYNFDPILDAPVTEAAIRRGRK